VSGNGEDNDDVSAHDRGTILIQLEQFIPFREGTKWQKPPQLYHQFWKIIFICDKVFVLIAD